jgi:hypothetical protein
MAVLALVEPTLGAVEAVPIVREEGVAAKGLATARALVEAGQGKVSGGISCMGSLVVLSA